MPFVHKTLGGRMSKSLQDALGENAWSVSAVMFDLNAMHDDEGRPISERRADALARVDVEMEMKKCPFGGIRKDKWMNVSALTQIANYYNDTLAELSTFRYQISGDNASWDDILAGVIDQLAGPAIYLLQHRNLQGPVPAKIAVGHKLAAGMFGVLCELQERIALGAKIDVSVDSFMNLIDETGALVGASEACAGSPPMIRKACVALIERKTQDKIEIECDQTRLELARCLALQVQLGTFWDLYDRVHLWSLIRGEFRQYLSPFNHFLERKLDHAASELGKKVPIKPIPDSLPKGLADGVRQKLTAALNDTTDQKNLAEDLDSITKMLKETDNTISYSGDTKVFATTASNYLNTYRLIKAELSKLEIELRKLLNFSEEAPIKFGSAALPASKALHWYELIFGRKLGSDDRLTGDSTKVRGAAVSSF